MIAHVLQWAFQITSVLCTTYKRTRNLSKFITNLMWNQCPVRTWVSVTVSAPRKVVRYSQWRQSTSTKQLVVQFQVVVHSLMFRIAWQSFKTIPRKTLLTLLQSPKLSICFQSTGICPWEALLAAAEFKVHFTSSHNFSCTVSFTLNQNDVSMSTNLTELQL